MGMQVAGQEQVYLLTDDSKVLLLVRSVEVTVHENLGEAARPEVLNPGIYRARCTICGSNFTSGGI
jgi:hypothetical protein